MIRGRVRNRFFSRGGGGGNLICLEGVEAKGAGYGEGGDYFCLFFCKAGGGEYYCLGARWADGEGRGGKIIMSDFGKRREESIILFAEKEFKPEGRGRGRGEGAHYYYYFFVARPGGVNIIVWVRGGLTGRGGGGRL